MTTIKEIMDWIDKEISFSQRHSLNTIRDQEFERTLNKVKSKLKELAKKELEEIESNISVGDYEDTADVLLLDYKKDLEELVKEDG